MRISKVIKLWNELTGILSQSPMPERQTAQNLKWNVPNAIRRLKDENNGYAISFELQKALNRIGVWSNRYTVFCPTEDVMEGIYQLMIRTMETYGEKYNFKKGYYNPIEDKRNNNVDDCTGYYWVSLA